jgi:hypothetical protein
VAFPLRRTLDPLTEPVSAEAMKNYLRVDVDEDNELIMGLISAARERAEDLTSRSLVPQQWTFALDMFPTWWLETGLSTNFYGIQHPGHRSLFRHDGNVITLPRGPLISVDSIQYIDGSGTLQTLDPATYVIDYLSEPARITPAYGLSWPTTQWTVNAVTIKFTVGYQQTVTETLTVSSSAPFTVTVGRAVTAQTLVSVTSVPSGPVVTGCTLNNGVITFPTNAQANTKVSVVYLVSSIPQSFIHAIKLMCGAWYENRAEVVQGGGNFNSMPTPISAVSLLAMYDMLPVGYPRS